MVWLVQSAAQPVDISCRLRFEWFILRISTIRSAPQLRAADLFAQLFATKASLYLKTRDESVLDVLHFIDVHTGSPLQVWNVRDQFIAQD